MSRQKLVICIVMVVLAGAGIAWFLLSINEHKADQAVQSVASVKTLRSEEIGMIVERGASLVPKELDRASQDAGQLWALSQPNDSRQEFVIDANYEQGASLKKLTAVTKQSLRDSVVTNINLQLPKQYPEYKEIVQRNLSINGIDANETIFEYVSNGVKIKQRLVLYFKNSDTAVYIRAQAKADEYEAANDQYFEPLLMSVKFD
jgi:patatin-like phospholipase/acyl hydrolase